MLLRRTQSLYADAASGYVAVAMDRGRQ